MAIQVTIYWYTLHRFEPQARVTDLINRFKSGGVRMDINYITVVHNG